MGTPLRVLAVFMLAVLTFVAAKECGTPRGSSWSSLSTGSIRHADVPDASSTLDAGAGPLSIPNAALEPVGWGDLDGWTSDDHAVAFATFNASCRAIVRAVAFRAESETDHAADPRPLLAALEQVCIRAMRAGRTRIRDGTAVLRDQFRSGANPQARRSRGLCHWLLRSDRRWLAIPDQGIHGAFISAAS